MTFELGLSGLLDSCEVDSINAIIASARLKELDWRQNSNLGWSAFMNVE